MASALKYLKWTVLGITGAFLALVVFLVLWIDPNDYRDDITALVKDKTGLVLAIDGNIGWNFYPSIGFQVERLSLATAEGEAPLASVAKAAVSVELLPLFSRQVNVKTLFVDGLNANLVVDEQGKGNWEALTAGSGDAEAAPAEAPAADSGPAPTINVPQIVVTQAVLDYVDRNPAAPAHYTVTVQELVAEDIAVDREFPFRLVAAVDDHAGLKIDVDTRAFVTLDLPNTRYGLRALEVKAAITGILDQPFEVTLGADIDADMQQQVVTLPRLAIDATNLAVGSRPVAVKVAATVSADLGKQLYALRDLTVDAANLDFTGKPVSASLKGALAADLAADTASVGPLAFSAAGVDGTLAMDVTALTQELAWTGRLDVAPFNAKTVLAGLGIDPPKTTDPKAMTQVALGTNLRGTKTSALLEDMDLRLDASHLRGRAGLADLATTAIVFDLALDALDADGYLPPPAPAGDPKAAPAATTAATPGAAATAQAEGLLPVETLRTLNLDGRFTAGKLSFMQWPMTKFAVKVSAKDGDLRIDPLSATVLDGGIRGNIRIDARGEQPRIVTHLQLDRLELGPVVQRYAKKDLLVGKASMKLDMDATGNDADTLLKKAIGGADFSFADATLRGTNLNNVLTETLTQQLGAFAMLVPDYQQKLPKELEQDTLLSTLAAGVKIKDGIAQVPALSAATKDGAVKGEGQFNLVTLDFDYRLAMRTEKLKDNKYLAKLEFPVTCKGNIAGSPADWCRPDTKAMGDLLKKAAENAAKDRLKGEVAAKLGIEAADTGTMKQEVKKEAEKKVKQKANEELQKQLQKLF